MFEGTFDSHRVAVKKLLLQSLTARSQKQFDAEVAIMMELRHPAIIQFFGALNEPGLIAMARLFH